MKGKANILLAEDDKNLGFVLKDFLELSGYTVELCEDGQSALETFLQGFYDLCILDVMMPVKDGFTLAQEIRKKNRMVPIIFLTARSMEEDKIRGFKAGGDDYVTKPFSTEELKLRIEALLKRASFQINQGSGSEHYSIGIFTFDYENQILLSPDGERRLTRKEAELLLLLCQNKNRVLRREFALKTVWGSDDYFMGRSMDVYVTKLRKFLSDDPNVSIVNAHKVGFKLEVKQPE
ncbi:MAG: response regulator transcription factor [Bacteroidales bacterium]